MVTGSKAIKLSQTSSRTYMRLDMIVCDDQPNLNGELLTKEFLENYSETLIGMPIQVDRARIERGLYSSLTHRAEQGELKTDSIGAVDKVWLETDVDTDVTTMYASAKIWKRYSAVCDAIKELYDDNNLKFSWEVIVDEGEEIDGINHWKTGEWFAHTIVSMPSYPIAKAQLLVAELKENSEENKKEVKDLDGILIAGMSQSMLREKISAKLEYSQWTVETFMDDNKAVIRDWEENKYYIVEFSVNGEEVEVNEEMKMEGALIWKPVDEVSEADLRVAELEKEKEELVAKIAELETVEEVVKPVESTEEVIVAEVVESVEKNEVKEPVVDESDKIVKYAEVIAKLSETVKTLEAKVEELEPYRLQAEKLAEEKVLAELNAVKESLKNTAQSIVGEGNEITAEMATAVEEADEKALKVAIAEFVIANASVVESNIKVAELEPKVIVGTEDEDYSIKDKDIELY
jgi:hypothetical protein